MKPAVLDHDDIEHLRGIAEYFRGFPNNDDHQADALFIEDVISKVVQFQNNLAAQREEKDA